MNKKQIIELLEKEFEMATREFDKALEAKKEYFKKAKDGEMAGEFANSQYYLVLSQRMENEATMQATISTKLAEMLAKIENVGFDEKNEQLMKKYNLIKEF